MRQLTVLATASLAMAPNWNPGLDIPDASSRYLFPQDKAKRAHIAFSELESHVSAASLPRQAI